MMWLGTNVLNAVAKSNSEGRKRVGAVVWDSRCPTVFGVIAHFSRLFLFFLKILVCKTSHAQGCLVD